MFVTFEGPEGAGKSTAIRALAEEFRSRGMDVVTTREPGAGEVGKAIRNVLLHGEAIDPKTELMLYLADRAEHVAGTIRPALDRGALVLCDRYADSTLVYQGHARGFDLTRLRALNDFVTGGLKPDLTILFDLDPAEGLARIKDADRLDKEPIAFHEKVRHGFLDEAEREPARWKKIDASRPPAEVLAGCREAILAAMS